VVDRKSGNDDYPLIRFDPHAAARIDDHDVGRRRQGSAKACWVLMRGARADRFGCASHRKIFQSHQKLPSWLSQKTDRYWCAPVGTPPRRKFRQFSRKSLAMSGGLNFRAG
jgi:hypothetical protein